MAGVGAEHQPFHQVRGPEGALDLDHAAHRPVFGTAHGRALRNGRPPPHKPRGHGSRCPSGPRAPRRGRRFRRGPARRRGPCRKTTLPSPWPGRPRRGDGHFRGPARPARHCRPRRAAGDRRRRRGRRRSRGAGGKGDSRGRGGRRRARGGDGARPGWPANAPAGRATGAPVSSSTATTSAIDVPSSSNSTSAAHRPGQWVHDHVGHGALLDRDADAPAYRLHGEVEGTGGHGAGVAVLVPGVLVGGGDGRPGQNVVELVEQYELPGLGELSRRVGRAAQVGGHGRTSARQRAKVLGRGGSSVSPRSGRSSSPRHGAGGRRRRWEGRSARPWRRNSYEGSTAPGASRCRRRSTGSMLSRFSRVGPPPWLPTP